MKSKSKRGGGHLPTWLVCLQKYKLIMEEPKKRGGKREGAGRKRKGVHYYGFRATQEVHDILSGIVGSKADFINKCILLNGYNARTE